MSSSFSLEILNTLKNVLNVPVEEDVFSMAKYFSLYLEYDHCLALKDYFAGKHIHKIHKVICELALFLVFRHSVEGSYNKALMYAENVNFSCDILLHKANLHFLMVSKYFSFLEIVLSLCRINLIKQLFCIFAVCIPKKGG